MNAITTIAGLKAPEKIVKSIQSASAQTGVDFSYLIHQAKAESSFRSDVKAKTSSATGLFQFIESTWLDMAEKHGHKYGLEGLDKSALLEKRKDPQIASLMAAELARENKAVLESKTNAKIGATELYFAHFLGAGSASDFINALEKDGTQSAAQLFPSAAKANKSVFYNADGSSKSLQEVYAYFDKKFEGTKQISDVQVANVEEKPNTAEVQTQEVFIPQVKKGYTHIPLEPLKAFDNDIQKMVLSSVFLDMQMLNQLKSEQVLTQNNIPSLFALMEAENFR